MRVSFQKAYQALLGPSLVKIGRKFKMLFKQETGCYWALDMMPVLNFDSYHTQRQQECDKIEHFVQIPLVLVTLSSPEPKTQVSFSDQNLSIVPHLRCRRRKLFTF